MQEGTFKLSAFLRKHRRNIGIPLVLAALYLSRFDPRYLSLSVVLVALGELIRIWAAGHLRKEQVLTTGGPYQFVRNPLYIGSFLIGVGFALISGSLWVWMIVIAYFLLVYIPVVRFEEKILSEKFHEEYAKYSSRIPAFYPALRVYPSSTDFSFRQAIKNKEYNAIFGILAGYLLIILRSEFLR